MKPFLFLISITILLSCKKDKSLPDVIDPVFDNYYFPPNTGDTWETKTTASLGWDNAKLTEAFDYAGSKNCFE